MSSNFNNKVIVITGGAGILGEGFSRAFAKQGAKVVILGRDEAKAQNLAEQIIADGGTAIGLRADVTNLNSLKEAHNLINEKFGKTDILINGAGGNHPDSVTAHEVFDIEKSVDKDFFSLTGESIRFVMDLNFMGTLLPIQVFAKDMIGRKDCSIVNISSVAAFHPLTKIPAYSAAKAAISNFTQWLAIYFAKEQIRVNAIAPGFFLTEQNRFLLTKEDGSLTERGEKVMRNTPMGRFGKPEDLHSTLLWLCHSDAAFITGITVPVDGGFTAYGVV